MFYGDAQAVYPEFGGVVLDPEEGERLATALGPKGKLLILRNHGLLTVGQTVDEAAYLFTLAERSCEIQLKVDAAAACGIPERTIDDRVAEYTFEMTSDPVCLPVNMTSFMSLTLYRRRYTANSNRRMNLSWKLLGVDSCSDFM